MKLTEKQRDFIINTIRSCAGVIGYLFGSNARGTVTPMSDIDIAVAFPATMSPEEQENAVENIRGKLEQVFGIDNVDVISVALIKSPLLLHLATLSEGIVLFSDDDSLKNTISIRALHSYEDTKPLRRTQYEALKRSLA